MSGNLLLYFFCLLINTPVLLTARSKTWSNKPQIETPSYESLEILPYISSKLADRTSIMTEKIDEHDKDKLLTLFTNTKKEVAIISEAETTTPTREEIGIIRSKKVKDAEAFLSEMLRVLQNLFAKKPQHENEQPPSKHNNGHNIAWSYYDDVGK